MSLHKWMLDTNAVSEIIHDEAGTLALRAGGVGVDRLCLSIIVASELRYGALRRGSDRLTRRVEAVLSSIDVVSFEPPGDRHYGSIRAALEVNGTPIGATDLLIAAHALALDLTLVTANTREFSRVPNLRVENWLN